MESSLQTLHDLLFEMGKLNSELWQAIEDLSPKMTDESYNEASISLRVVPTGRIPKPRSNLLQSCMSLETSDVNRRHTDSSLIADEY